VNQLGRWPLAAQDLGPGRPLVIGFVNNSSDRALKSAEAQFLKVLTAAADGIELQVRFFTFRKYRAANVQPGTPKIPMPTSQSCTTPIWTG